MLDIAVLIPCLNEEKTIEKVIKDFRKSLPKAEIFVYDNNSTDKTAQIAEKTGAIVRHETKKGKGNVIRSMFRDIDAKCYLLVDGDDTYDSKDAKKLCDYVLRGGYDMVVGDRLSSTYFTENKRAFHNFGNVLVRKIINRVYQSDINDIMTGYRAMSYRFVKTTPILSQGFEVETEMTIFTLDRNLNIINSTIEYKDRPQGSESKLKTFSDGYRVLKAIALLYKDYKPFRFFSAIALICFITSLAFLLPVLIEYIQTGFVPRFPSFIASVLFMIISTQSFFSGLILQNIANQEKRQFELELNKRTDAKKLSQK